MLLRVRFSVLFVSLLSAVNGQRVSTTFLEGIFDGWTAKPAQFPFHALIGCVFDDGYVQWICNGAILNNRFIITSATCANSCDNFKIRVGSIVHGYMNITQGVTSEYVTAPGTRPRYFPGYVAGSTEHDIALLEVSQQIIYSHSVQEVILPKRNESTLGSNVSVVATGFGQYHKYNPYWELQFLTLNTLNSSNCSEYFPNADANRTMCAQGSDYNNRQKRGSMCQEFGSPLVLKSDNRTLVGLYQYSRESCDEGGPEVFIRIGSYLRWIRRTARFGLLDSNIFYILKN